VTRVAPLPTTLIAGVALVATSLSAAELADDVLARVGDETVTLAQFEQELRGYGVPEWNGLTKARREVGLDGSDPIQRRQALDNLVHRQLLALGALADVEGAEAIRDSVRRAMLTFEVWLDVRQQLYPGPDGLSRDAIQAFREERTARWFGRHIVVASLDDVKVVEERLESGEPFANVAKELSIDIGSRAAGGRMFPVREGDTFPALNDLFFSLEPGEWGGPVRTRLGYHVARCDSILDSFEDEVIYDAERLAYVIRRGAYFGGIDAFMADHAEEIGVEIHEDGVHEIIAHLWATPSNVLPPTLEPGWTPTDQPVATTDTGVTLTVAGFFELFPSLGIDDWPIPKNPVTVRTSARRLAVALHRVNEVEAGSRDLADDAWARVDRAVNRALGQRYLDVEANAGVVDSVRAEEIFARRQDAFMVPESVSIAAIGVSEREHAEELHDLLIAGVDFADVASRGKELDPDSYAAPHTPFMPRGSFPESDSLLFALEVGEVSDVVPVGKGFQLYKVLQRRPPRPVRRIELEDSVLIERAQAVADIEAQDRAIARLRERFPVVMNEELVARVVDGGSQ